MSRSGRLSMKLMHKLKCSRAIALKMINDRVDMLMREQKCTAKEAFAKLQAEWDLDRRKK